jgi:hypothetical protein
MSDDFEFLRTRLPGYLGYADEEARHDSDMRVRAFVGERLSDARDRLGDLDDATRTLLDAVMLRCMFTDQVFVKKFEHAELGEAMLAALVRSDRSLVDAGVALETVSAPHASGVLHAIDEQLDYRRAPEPLPS